MKKLKIVGASEISEEDIKSGKVASAHADAEFKAKKMIKMGPVQLIAQQREKERREFEREKRKAKEEKAKKMEKFKEGIRNSLK